MSLTHSIFLPAALAALLAMFVARLAMWTCIRTGWVDRPDWRKHHDGLIPLAGGLTIFAALVIAAPWVGAHDAHSTPFWLSAFPVFAIGFADDRSPIRVRYRLATQMVAAYAFVALSGTTVGELHELVGPQPITLGVMALPFAMIGMVGLTNAVNMIDGMDGLAGSVVLVALFWVLVALASVAGDTAASEAATRAATPAAMVAALIAGALAGFLVFNLRTPWRSRAAMFLGDGGSMSLGFLLAALLIHASGGFGAFGMPPVAALWIAAIPLYDMGSAILRRDLDGAKVLAPDRRHLHHLLLALGLTPARSVAVLQGIGFALGGVGVLGWRAGVPNYVMFWGFVALCAACFFASRRAWERLTPPRPAPPLGGSDPARSTRTAP